MDKSLLEKAKAPMAALIQNRNNLKTKTKHAFAFLLLALLAPIAAQAQSFGGGSGTETDPYIISTTAHMHQLTVDVNSGIDYMWVYFRLEADLDFQGILYTPIGCFVGDASPTGFHAFSGFFNGNGHTIKNIRIGTVNATMSYLGLFGVAHYPCCIENLTLASSSLNGIGAVGGIVGCLLGYYTNRRGIINCTVASDVTISGNEDVGGIVGYMHGRVNGCFNFAAVRGNTNVGAIAGIADALNYIINCYVGGNCTLGAVGQSGSSTGSDEGVDVTHLSTITYAQGIYGSVLSNADFNIQLTDYYRCGRTVNIQLSVEREVPEGYYGQTFVVGDTELDPNPNLSGRYTYTLPVANDALIDLGDVKRDIAYTNWVEISIPAQDYTSQALTPVVTVTDCKDGTPVTLVEDIDFRVVLPSGGCSYPGDYTITVFGMGDFGNVTTATFHINSPGISFEGNGSDETPYLIKNTEDMTAFANLVNAGIDCQGLHFRLTAGLDYTGKTYTPVGNSSRPFKGSFDGCFNAFSNVTVSVDISGGLFGKLGNGGSIRNVYLSESDINGEYNAGGIAGYSEGTIENCYVQESVMVSGESMVGGIVGTSKGSVNYCENKATVSGTSTQVGGIVGSMISGKVTECLNEGNVSSENAFVGGIVGKFDNAIIEECINTGTVSTNNYAVGGIVGYGSGYSSNNRINRCLNLTQVEGNRSVGGIIGYFYGGNVTYEGNYYAGECTTGGINGNDEAGARRGYIISNDEDVYADIFPIDDETGKFVGITYDGIFYVGAGETTKLLIEKVEGAPEGIIAASAGILKPLDEEFYDSNDLFYLLTMPSEGGNVNLSIAEGVGLTVAGYDESAKSGWKFIASPVVCDVAAGTVTNIFGASAYDLYHFDQSEELEWRNYKAEPFELENGKGYLYASKEDVALVFRGTYNTATEPVEVPLTYDANASFAGWNLVGNPFHVAAYANRSYCQPKLLQDERGWHGHRTRGRFVGNAHRCLHRRDGEGRSDGRNGDLQPCHGTKRRQRNNPNCVKSGR